MSSYQQKPPTVIKCRNDGCGIEIFWKKGERQPYEKGSGQKHVCQAWIDKQNALHGTGQQVKLPVEPHAKEVIMTGSAAAPQQQNPSETNVWLRSILEMLKEIRDNIEVNNKYTRLVWEEMKSFTEDTTPLAPSKPTTSFTTKNKPIDPLAHLNFEEHHQQGDDIYDEIADTDDHSREVE
jgi:hypothetical protein